MISSIIKLNLSEFVLRILQNDALNFEFIKKNNEPNINALLNKLIPNLVYYRKLRREEIRSILEHEFMRDDSEKIYECVNAVIDQVYFSDAELEELNEIVWFRPSEKKRALFDEIEDSETKITMQSTSVYIRGLLNEYARLPQYKREGILFDGELRDFAEACETGKTFHARVNGKSLRIFAFHYVYEYTYDQGNYLIGYDLTNKMIGAIALHKIRDSYVVERKHTPSASLIATLQKYYEDKEYSEIVSFEEEVC